MRAEDKTSFYVFGFILTLFLSSSFLFSCARGCGKKGTPQETTSGLQDLNIGGVVKDEKDNPVESALVSVKIDINGDNLFSPDETFSTMTNKDGMFFIPNELITARLSETGEGKNLLTGRILTGRILTARMQVEVVKPGFAKNSFHADQPGFFSVKLAQASSARDTDLKDGAQFSLVSLPGRAPILLAGKEAGRAGRIKKQNKKEGKF